MAETVENRKIFFEIYIFYQNIIPRDKKLAEVHKIVSY